MREIGKIEKIKPAIIKTVNPFNLDRKFYVLFYILYVFYRYDSFLLNHDFYVILKLRLKKIDRKNSFLNNKYITSC